MNEIMNVLNNSVVQFVLAEFLGWFLSTILEIHQNKKNQPEVLRKPQVEKKVSLQFTYSKTVSHKEDEK